jgi:hypothetical protein
MEESSANQASLTVLGGPKAGLRFVIEDSVDNIVIGSDPSCRFHIDLPGVSPVHARLWVDPQGVTVYETNSPRGLYVNDDRVVAQATLRNGDILWLGTPGDEDVVMIQCRLPQGKATARVAPPAISDDAIDETVALGALPAEAALTEAGFAVEAAAEPEPVAEPAAEAEPEAEPEPELQAEAEPEPEPEIAAVSEPEAIEATLADAPNLAAPATEVFIVDDSLNGRPAEPPPSAPAPESAHFELDFSKAPSSFEEGLSARAPEPTVAMPAAPAPAEAPTLAEIAPPPPPPAPATPSYPAPAAAARARETPAPVRPEPPPRPRRPPARPAPAAPPPPVAPPEEPRAGSSAALKFGLLGVGVLVVAVAGFVALRLFRPASAPGRTAPPTTVAMAPPSTEAPAPAETPPVETSPSAEPQPPAPIPEEVVVVPSAPSPAPPTAAPSRPPTPSPRATPSPRPSPRTTATPPPTAAPVQQAASQVPALLGQAAAAVSARQFDAAVAAFDEVLKVDPQNASAAQGKAAAQASAAGYKRGFAAGRTRLSGKESKADLGGFETTGVKVAKVPDYSGRIEFEVTPPRVLPGDSYTVRVYLVNDGKKDFKIGSVSVVTLVNGSRSGGPVAVRAREIAPRDRILLDERTAEWAAGTTSWSLEAVVGSDRDATFTNRLNWR